MAKYDYPLVVIGAGAGGLVIAIGAAKAGKRVLLVERGTYGGDCTHVGCIPSKTLIAEAHKGHGDGAAALRRVREVVEGFVGEEGPSALKEHGVETLTGTATFVDAHTLNVDGATVTANQIVIATGSHPVIPPIKGLADVPFLTNETIFNLKAIPKSMGIVGGGAIGAELAQALHQLGCRVTIIEFLDHLLAREEPETIELMEQTLSSQGLTLQLGHTAEAVQNTNGSICVLLRDRKTNTEETLCFEQLLLAVGRAPNSKSLNLEALGIESGGPIPIDKYGRTPCKNVWAVGDCTGGPQFTHWAEAQARAILTSLLLPGPFKVKLPTQAMPAVTFTDPEVARVGLTQAEAIEKYGKRRIATYHLPFSKIDRAVTTGRTDGFIKLVTRKWSGKLVGATIVGERAGAMLPELGLAMKYGIPLRKIASLVHAYPTYGHGVRRAADLWLSQTIIPSLKKLIGK